MLLGPAQHSKERLKKLADKFAQSTSNRREVTEIAKHINPSPSQVPSEENTTKRKRKKPELFNPDMDGLNDKGRVSSNADAKRITRSSKK